MSIGGLGSGSVDPWEDWSFDEDDASVEEVQKRSAEKEVEALSPDEQRKLSRAELAKVSSKVEKAQKEMKDGISAVKISRQRHRSYSSSFLVTKEGEIFRFMHESPKVVRKGLLGKEKQTVPEEKEVGEGRERKVIGLEHEGERSHVLALVKPGIKLTPDTMEAARRFADNPRIACGHYTTWKDNDGELKEGFLMERAQGGNLFELLHATELSREEQKRVMLGVALALNELHKVGFAHRDIKPENILLNEDQIKLADLGLVIKERLGVVHKDVVGTAQYMAPEVVKQRCEDWQRADIFALGVMFYEVLKKQHITQFSDRLDVQLSRMGSLTFADLESKFPEKENDPILELIKEMVNPTEPTKRPYISEVIDRLKSM